MAATMVEFSVPCKDDKKYQGVFFYDSSFGDKDFLEKLDFKSREIRGVMTSSQEKKYFTFYNWQKYLLSQAVKRSDGLIEKKGLFLIEEIKKSENEICKSNMPLVMSMFRTFRRYTHNFDEFISIGNFALLDCVRMFDPFRGFKFSGYACSAIKRKYCVLLEEEKSGKISGNVDVYIQEIVARGCRDLGTILGDREEIRKVVRVLEDPSTSFLDEREEKIISERYPLDSKEGKTLEEIGKELGLTRERVRQIERTALRKLRRSLNKEKILF